MATAYAALVSVMHTIEQIQEHPRPPIQFDTTQVEHLKSKIRFLQEFLEDDHHNTIDHGLESRIADATHAAEDVIDSHIRNHQIIDQEERIGSTNDDFFRSLERVIENLDDLIKKEVVGVKDDYEQSQGCNKLPREHPMLRTSSSSSKPPNPKTYGENIMVGIDDILRGIMDKLTQQHDSGGRQIISISGMGGIGKTTLALKVYENPYIKNYFDIRAWATISKDYNTHESLVELVHCLYGYKESKESLREKGEDALGEQLHKCLFGRRYLVVLDDVWDVEAWIRVKTFLPASKGSGIVITTRESTVASIGSHRFGMNLLDECKSWDLFCKLVFENDCCPLELEDVGKKISNNCRGLPLSITVIGGHLAKSPRTREYWQYIAENLSSVVNSEDNEHCLKILALSYTHLPIHLKPCFLYMGIFLEGEEIRVPKLIRLLVAEGFLKPIIGKSLEETARDYLNDLVGRNLIIVVESTFRGKLKRCKMHDLLRDFCLKEATQKNFMCIVQKQWLDILGVSNNKRIIVVHPSALDMEYPVLKSLGALIRTLIYHGMLPTIDNELLRVLAPISSTSSLCMSEDTIVEFTHHMVNLRYIEFPSRERLSGFAIPPSRLSGFVIPPSICLLWNLQYLVIHGYIEIKAPPEIWKMPHLRQISVFSMSLPHPPIEDSDILKSLHSVETILNFSFHEQVVNRIPNVKKLAVRYDDKPLGVDEGPYTLNNVARVEKLESFECYFHYTGIVAQSGMRQNLNLPHSIKKLRISHLHWDDVTTKIGSLPLLEVLGLDRCRGSEWELVEGQFCHLKILTLVRCRGLQYFKADGSHFPSLQKLVLTDMFGLEEISHDIGDIPMLKLIHLKSCPDSAVISAKEIAEEQYELGNEELQVKAYLDYDSDLTESLSNTCNFHSRKW